MLADDWMILQTKKKELVLEEITWHQDRANSPVYPNVSFGLLKDKKLFWENLLIKPKMTMILKWEEPDDSLPTMS